jgi:hypothetical protein
MTSERTPFLQAGTYFASVRCTNMETKFRVSVSLIESVLYNNQLSTGGVAPAEWCVPVAG